MRLPDDTILKRSEMLELLASDARFVHASESELSDFLDRIYSREGRESVNRTYPDCAPDVLYNAWQQGKLDEQLYDAFYTIAQASAELHSVCCICGEVSLAYEHRLPIDLQEHLAPRITIFQCADEGETCVREFGVTPPICNLCAYHFVKRGRRRDNWRIHGSLWDDALAELVMNVAAKRRIQKNSDVWAKLRFDPRSPAIG